MQLHAKVSRFKNPKIYTYIRIYIRIRIYVYIVVVYVYIYIYIYTYAYTYISSSSSSYIALYARTILDIMKRIKSRGQSFRRAIHEQSKILYMHGNLVHGSHTKQLPRIAHNANTCIIQQTKKLNNLRLQKVSILIVNH